MIITVAGEHDRIEKSVLAINLAALRARDGRKVLLIDAGRYRNGFLWRVRRSDAGMRLDVPVLPVTDGGLYTALQNHGRRFQDIVIDTAEAGSINMRTALVAARKAIVPVHPDVHCLHGEEALVERMNAARLFNPSLCTLVLIAGSSDRSCAQQTAAAQDLASRIPSGAVARTVIHGRIGMHGAFMRGMSVFEWPASNTPAAAEMQQLYQEVYGAAARHSTIATGIEALGKLLAGLRASENLQRQR